MLPEELINLVNDVISCRCERQNVELKAAHEGTPERLYDTLSAFANQRGGGVIVFGVDERAGFEVVGVYDAQDLQAKVTSKALQMEPVVRPVFTVAEMGGRTIVGAEVAECDPLSKPCFYRGSGRIRGSYVRVGEADLPMTEYEVYSYEAFRRQIHDELRVVERAETADIDRGALEEYLVSLRRAKPNLARQSDARILELQGLVDGGVPTVAGLVLLGEYPQAFLPQLCVTALVVPGTQVGDVGEAGERFVDNQRIEGRLPQMLEATLAFVRRNMRRSTVIDEDGRRADRDEYPMVAVRELVLNALIHRDYSIHTEGSPVRVVLYADRIEVESPGGLYGRVTVEDLGHVPADTRNPFLTGAMEVLGVTENRFSGIPTVMAELEGAGLPPATFESRRGMFRATLRNGSMETRDRDVVSGPGGLSDTQRKILAFCSEPRSRAEVAELLGVDTLPYVTRRYLRPLVDAGLLRLTIPDAPRSKNQRYVAVG